MTELLQKLYSSGALPSFLVWLASAAVLAGAAVWVPLAGRRSRLAEPEPEPDNSSRNQWNGRLGAFEHPRTAVHGVLCRGCGERIPRGGAYYVTLEGLNCAKCELARREGIQLSDPENALGDFPHRDSGE